MKITVMTLALFALLSCNTASKETYSEGIPRETRSEIRNTIRSQLANIKKCYEEEIKINPEAEGKIIARFQVDGKGQVTGQKPNIENFKNEESGQRVSDCIMSILIETKFPAAPEGTFAEISYPFVFQKNK